MLTNKKQKMISDSSVVPTACPVIFRHSAIISCQVELLRMLDAAKDQDGNLSLMGWSAAYLAVSSLLIAFFILDGIYLFKDSSDESQK